MLDCCRLNAPWNIVNFRFSFFRIIMGQTLVPFYGNLFEQQNFVQTLQQQILMSKEASERPCLYRKLTTK